MRIALINKVFSQSGGGAERYAVDLTTGLIERGVEVHCFGNVIEDVPDSVIRHTIVNPRKPGWRKILVFNTAARSGLEDMPFDAVYSLTQAFPTDMYFMGGGMHRHWMRVRLPNPLLRWLKYVISPTNIAQVWIEDKLCQPENCAFIIANSHMIKRHAILYGNVDPRCVHVVHNGIDPKRFNPGVRTSHRNAMRLKLGLSREDLAILFVAHNWPRKGLGTLVDALGQLGTDGQRYRILVAGHGKEAPFRRQADDAGLSPRQLCVLGSVAQPEHLYAAGDVFVLPTLYDPCAGVTVEALACGLPAISTANNGASEMIRENETGYVLEDPRDSATLATHLRALLDDDRRARMSAAASQNVRTFDDVIDDTLTVMREVASIRTPPSQTSPDWP